MNSTNRSEQALELLADIRVKLNTGICKTAEEVYNIQVGLDAIEAALLFRDTEIEQLGSATDKIRLQHSRECKQYQALIDELREGLAPIARYANATPSRVRDEDFVLIPKVHAEIAVDLLKPDGGGNG